MICKITIFKMTDINCESTDFIDHIPADIFVLSNSAPLCRSYKYLAQRSNNLQSGDLVIIPFGQKELIGIMLEKINNNEDDYKGNIKHILHHLPINVSRETLQLARSIADYTMSSFGEVLKMIIPLKAKDILSAVTKKSIEKININANYQNDVIFSEEQKIAISQIFSAVEKNEKPILLQGVTGSGKTEVYFEVIRKIIDDDNDAQILILVPEIALTNQLNNRFEKFFGFKPIIWHSRTKKVSDWININNGKIRAVIGARSAVFLPFKNLKIIVLDEEHDSASYKQESHVFYHARDAAIMRAEYNNAAIILSSATPSIESLAKAQSLEYEHILLKSRYNANPPQIKIIDLNSPRANIGKGRYISEELRQAIIANLQKNYQTLIFLNKRGYAPFILCITCKERISCKNCSSWMVFFSKNKELRCNYCGYSICVPRKCNSCTDGKLIACGPGVERIVDELSTFLSTRPEQNMFHVEQEKMFHVEHSQSNAAQSENTRKTRSPRIAIMSSDIKEQREIIQAIQKNEIDIIVGTQIMAKGHDLPMLTVVGIIDADASMYGNDLRAIEKTYQLLTQVSGRAGRAKDPGTVFIQTHFPESQEMINMQQINNHEDSNAFINKELKARHQNNLPPFFTFIAIIIRGKNPDKTYEYCYNLAEEAEKFSKEANAKEIKILGPAKAPMHIINQHYRWRFLIKSRIYDAEIRAFIKKWIISVKKPNDIIVQIDVDPQSFN